MSLYVGNLSTDCTELILYEKFSTMGPIMSVKVCTHPDYGHSLGYGYVNFMDKTDAETAINILNYRLLNGRMMRIMWAQSGLPAVLSKNANLFVKNIDRNVDERNLYTAFGEFGKILSLKINRDSSGASKGYGYVQFESDSSADNALVAMDGKLLGGKIISVSRFVSRERRSPNQDPDNYTNVFFKNFNTKFSDRDLTDLCKRFGRITSACIMKDDWNVSKRFGFVSFEEPDSARKAVEELNDILLNGRRLFVGPAKTKAQRKCEVFRDTQVDSNGF